MLLWAKLASPGRGELSPPIRPAVLRRGGEGFDTALVSLEIAGLYAEQGRTGELKRLA